MRLASHGMYSYSPSLASEHTNKLVSGSFVCTEHVSDLAPADSDITRGYVRVRACGVT
jgi:hypothetical protein